MTLLHRTGRPRLDRVRGRRLGLRARRRLALSGDLVECEPGCRSGWPGPDACPRCRAAEMADREAW